MLSDAMAVPTIAVTDLDVARAFYEDTLRLPLLEAAPYALRFRAGPGQVSVRRGQPNVGQTVLHFEVEDLDAVMTELSGRGVRFEEYESPKTTNGVAQIGPARAAWFTDPSGNVIGLRQGPVPRAAPGGDGDEAAAPA
jgi:catechol 2,3-dioxygenase-like lactoylglutathione lyase family enzyme